jgi:hypothetical protein
MLANPDAAFPLAQRLQSPEGAQLGEVFAFLSSLYFRGKLAYARRFCQVPAELPGVLVITPGDGLCRDVEPISAEHLRELRLVSVDASNPRYVEPLLRDARALAEHGAAAARFVLLGSVASAKYVQPLLEVFGERLWFPTEFVGRGDMSRGGLLLRSVRENRELEYAKVHGAVVHGPRAPRLPKRPRA